MPPSKPVNKALLALTASALAIPGMCPTAQAQVSSTSDDALSSPTADGTSLLNYRYSAYREGDIPASKTAGNKSSQRYEVDSNQFHLASELDATSDLTADVVLETMSGASPWFVIPGANGKPVQVMSGATIHDLREALQLRANKRFNAVTGSLSGGFSNERDYSSVNGGFESSWDFNSKLTTISGGASYTHDLIEPTDGGSVRFTSPPRIIHAHAYDVGAFVGLTQVLTADTEIQTSLSYTFENGYLSDPYKLAYVAGNNLNDSRPSVRHKLAWLTRLRQDLPFADAALHLDYRYFRDDWGVVAHTVDLAWFQNLPQSWALVPRVRWYSQSEANFYQPYYTTARDDGLYSSDYRLSPFGALSETLSIYKRWHSWNISFRFENYRSGGAYSLRSVDVENPGLVNFRVYSAGIAKTF